MTSTRHVPKQGNRIRSNVRRRTIAIRHHTFGNMDLTTNSRSLPNFTISVTMNIFPTDTRTQHSLRAIVRHVRLHRTRTRDTTRVITNLPIGLRLHHTALFNVTITIVTLMARVNRKLDTSRTIARIMARLNRYLLDIDIMTALQAVTRAVRHSLTFNTTHVLTVAYPRACHRQPALARHVNTRIPAIRITIRPTAIRSHLQFHASSARTPLLIRYPVNTWCRTFNQVLRHTTSVPTVRHTTVTRHLGPRSTVHVITHHRAQHQILHVRVTAVRLTRNKRRTNIRQVSATRNNIHRVNVSPHDWLLSNGNDNNFIKTRRHNSYNINQWIEFYQHYDELNN